MADRIPPHSQDAERSVIGSCLQSRTALADVAEILKPDDFYDNANKTIYSAILDMFKLGRSVDIVTVAEELRNRKLLEAAGSSTYIATLAGEVPEVVNAAEYARIVREKSMLRQLILAAEEIKAKSYDTRTETESILDYAERSIFSLAQSSQKRDYQKLKDILVKDIMLIDEASRSDGTVTGVTTGFRELDKITAGLHPSDLIILAARPAMGKTSFALNIAQNAAIKGNASVLIFDLEMADVQLGMRLLSMESNVEMDKLKKGTLSPYEDWPKVQEAMERLGNANIAIDDTPSLSIFEIKNKCRRKKAEDGLDLVIIDYLQLMSIEGRTESRQQEISQLSRELKLLAREIDCPVIVLSQLSRAPELRQNKRPMLSDLRESGSIEQDADIVIFLYRDDYYNEDSENPGVCEVNIAKHRNGEVGTIDLTWVARYTKFADKA